MHIGSQLTSIEPFRAAFARLAELARALLARGHALRRIDFGGGLGVSYGNGAGPDLKAYAQAVRDAVRGLELDIILEPGRYLVADAGILLTRVIYMKDGATKRFAIVDGAMNDLIRPTLYEAWMPIRPVAEPAAGGRDQPGRRRRPDLRERRLPGAGPAPAAAGGRGPDRHRRLPAPTARSWRRPTIPGRWRRKSW